MDKTGEGWNYQGGIDCMYLVFLLLTSKRESETGSCLIIAWGSEPQSAVQIKKVPEGGSRCRFYRSGA